MAAITYSFTFKINSGQGLISQVVITVDGTGVVDPNTLFASALATLGNLTQELWLVCHINLKGTGFNGNYIETKKNWDKTGALAYKSYQST